MNVPDGEEDADAGAGPAGVGFVGNDDDATIGGSHDGFGIFRDGAVRVAEEGEAKKTKSQEVFNNLIQIQDQLL